MNLYKMIPKVDQILDNKVIKDLLDKNSKNLVMESIFLMDMIKILYQIRLKI